MSAPSKVDTESLAFDISGAARAMSVGRNKVYDEIAAGRLDARKVGRRTVISRAAIQAWLDSLPRLNSTAA
jgi:excisionase family DNA binding protein